MNADLSVNNDSTTSYLVALKDGFPSTITPSVGWSVKTSDSFGVFLRTDSGVFISIQHDGLVDGTFDIDTTVTGPIFWHEVAIAVTPGSHNYSVMLYPINPTGPLRPTVFAVPVYFGAAYEWNAAAIPPPPPASVNYPGTPVSSKPAKYFNELGVPVDSLSPEAVIRH